jgi:hypothetical protein
MCQCWVAQQRLGHLMLLLRAYAVLYWLNHAVLVWCWAVFLQNTISGVAQGLACPCRICRRTGTCSACCAATYASWLALAALRGPSWGSAAGCHTYVALMPAAAVQQNSTDVVQQASSCVAVQRIKNRFKVKTCAFSAIATGFEVTREAAQVQPPSATPSPAHLRPHAQSPPQIQCQQVEHTAHGWADQ